MLASTTITFLPQDLSSRRDRDTSTGSATGAVEHLSDRRSSSLLDEPGPQVLLQRLMRSCGSLPQHRVRVCGDILDLYARHGAIMAP